MELLHLRRRGVRRGRLRLVGTCSGAAASAALVRAEAAASKCRDRNCTLGKRFAGSGEL
jgi:hypothetical protein